MKRFFIFIFCCVTVGFYAQNSKQKPCALPEAAQFDFWLGKWSLTYGDTMHAANEITKEMDGCVVHEHFKDAPRNYFGESWSMYNPKEKKWQQTWVDNQGAYIVLTGNFENGEMKLFTEEKTDATGNRSRYRMTFYNITSAQFDWKWELTNDGGKTWKMNWQLHYSRAK